MILIVVIVSHITCRYITNYTMKTYNTISVEELIKTLSEQWSSSFEFKVVSDTKPDISSLKKRIKHCKNHMERQRLQKELNALYKEQKKGRR